MSKHWVSDIAEMHDKFGFIDKVAKLSPADLSALLDFRIKFLQEELDEITGAPNGDDVIDGLIDLCVVAIGTLDLFGIDSREAWNRVHAANMAKEVGIKPERPNPLGLPDLIKPTGWTAPSHEDLVTDELYMAITYDQAEI